MKIMRFVSLGIILEFAFFIFPFISDTTDASEVEILSFQQKQVKPEVMEEFQIITREISNSNAKWNAGITPVAELDQNQRQLLLGALEESETDVEVLIEKTGMAAQFPPSLDWRNVEGQDFMTSIKDQGICGSCVAFGVTGAVEANLNIIAGRADMDMDLSEQHLFSCGGGRCNSGWYIGSALNYLVTTGITDEDCFPYISGWAGDQQCSRSCQNWSEKVVKICSWNWVENNVDAIKSYLIEGPLATSMKVYTDFFYYTGGVYSHTWGNYEGGHCITFVGWDDSQQCWIVRNSWGTSWGENGYFKIAYNNSDIGTSTAFLTFFPVVRIFADKTAYTAGDNMQVGMSVDNPGEKYSGYVRIWAECSTYAKKIIYSKLHVIPNDFNYNNENFKSFILPELNQGNYNWFASLLNGSGTKTNTFNKFEFQIQ